MHLITSITLTRVEQIENKKTLNATAYTSTNRSSDDASTKAKCTM